MRMSRDSVTLSTWSLERQRGPNVRAAAAHGMSGIPEGLPPSPKGKKGTMAAKEEKPPEEIDIWQDCLRSFDVSSAKPAGEEEGADVPVSNEPYTLLVFGAAPI
jgi:hypothetical protein